MICYDLQVSYNYATCPQQAPRQPSNSGMTRQHATGLQVSQIHRPQYRPKQLCNYSSPGCPEHSCNNHVLTSFDLTEEYIRIHNGQVRILWVPTIHRTILRQASVMAPAKQREGHIANLAIGLAALRGTTAIPSTNQPQPWIKRFHPRTLQTFMETTGWLLHS